MKKSNLILLGALGTALFFSLVFQVAVHSNIKKGKANEIPVEIISEFRTVSYFDAIKATNRVKIVFNQNDTVKVVVKAPNNIIDSVSTKVVNKKLVINTSNKLKKTDSVLLLIDAPMLTKLELNDNSHFETNGSISGEKIHLEFKGESSGNLNLSYEFVQYLNNSEGEINIKGEINQIDLISNMKQ